MPDRNTEESSGVNWKNPSKPSDSRRITPIRETPPNDPAPDAPPADENEPPQKIQTVFDAPLPKSQNETLGREGNYLFPVGRVGCGKSTLTTHTLRYLLKSGEHLTEPNIELSCENASFRRMLIELDEQWQQGRFPEATPFRGPTEFAYAVTPLKKKGYPTLKFGFLEISGEDFKPLTDKDVPFPALLPSLDNFLENVNCNICFLFICRGDNLAGDDFLFTRFLAYLNERIKRPLRAQCSAALVLSDPEMCQRRLQFASNEPISGGPLDVDNFVKKFVPETAAKLAAWGDKAIITPFSVGTIKEEELPDGTIGQRLITDPSFTDASRLYNWLYYQFTGRSLGPGLFRRILDAVNSLGHD